MSEMVERVKAAIIEELDRQKIAAESWGNSFTGLNPPVDWGVVSCAAIAVVQKELNEILVGRVAVRKALEPDDPSASIRLRGAKLATAEAEECLRLVNEALE